MTPQQHEVCGRTPIPRTNASGKFVRASKYRHVFGQAAKKELCYENLKITKNAWDSNIINTNGKYLAVNWDASGGGAFAVIPLNEVGKAPDTVPLFRGHKGPVLDTAFNPFNHQQVVSCSEDGKILLWDIPQDFSFHKYVDENDNIKDIVTPTKVLSGHTRKVGHVEFHPCAENILASCSLDYTVKIWNLETGKPEITLQHKDLVTSFAFNYNGSLLATTSRDKKLRIWNVRSGEIVSEGPGHTGAKPSRVVWIGNTDRIVTTGFSKLSDRQVGIWDINNIENGPIDGFLVIDSSSGVLIPIFDESNSILYLAGKGDGNIRYFEYDNDILHDLSQYASTDPQRGFAVAPKYSVNIKENEILRSFKTVHDSSIEPVSFIVPRRSELFQEDIYPDAPSDKPALSASEWLAGKDVNGPLLLSLEALYDGTTPEVKDSAPATSVSEAKQAAKEEKPKQKLPEAKAPKAAESSKALETPKETTPSPTSIDDTLKTSDKVDSLLAKVDDESDDEDSRRVSESKDDDWEEVKKEDVEEPKLTKVEPKVESPKAEPQVEEAHSKETPEAKEEEKPKPKVVALNFSKADSSAPKKLETAAPATESKGEAPSADKAPESDTKGSNLRIGGTITLKGSLERLAALAEKLEAQVTLLTEAGLEKDARLAALEEKIDQLLK